jgi:hypothetical protein
MYLTCRPRKILTTSKQYSAQSLWRAVPTTTNTTAAAAVEVVLFFCVAISSCVCVLVSKCRAHYRTSGSRASLARCVILLARRSLY